MDERFSRNGGAITPEEQGRLRRARVFVAGCGGLGGYVLEHLARMGVGHITCADSGRFAKSDLNRQLLADMDALGREKAACARERILRIWPEADIRGITTHMDSGALPSLIRGCDLAIDALDNSKTRKALFSACKQAGIPVVHGAVRGWIAQAAFVPPNGALYDLLYPKDDVEYAPGTPIPVLSPAPGMAASMQASLAARYLCGRDCDSRLHFFDFERVEYSSALV